MTEDQIERLAERRMDALDREYLAGGLTEAEYQSEVDAIDREVNTLLQAARRATFLEDQTGKIAMLRRMTRDGGV